jgi:hypothetical protein
LSTSDEEARETAPLLILRNRFKPAEVTADTDSMSLTLSPPTRIAALVGALVLTGLAAIVFLVGRGAISGESSGDSTAPIVKTAPRITPPTTTARPRAATPRAVTGFAAKIDHALRHSRVVVVSVSMPGAAVDRVVLKEARAGARASHAAFVSISAANERAVSGLVAKTGILPSPAVVIVKRPGVVTTTFSVTDAGTIAQAVAQARR